MVRYILIIFIFVSLFLSFGVKSYAVDVIKVGITDDTYTEEGAASILPWNQPNMTLGWDIFYAKMRTRIYTYTSLDAVINQGYKVSDISSTKLFLWQSVNESGGNYAVEWGRGSQGWDQYQLKWLNQPQFVKHGDVVFSNEIGWQVLDFNEVLKDWYISGDTSIGIILKTQNEYNRGGIFWSSDCVNPLNYPRCESWQVPYLEVTIKDNHAPTTPEVITPVFNTIQSSKQLDFAWSSSIDEDGDSLTYGIEISKDQNLLNSSLLISGLTQTNYSYQIVDDGIYYFRIFVEDNRGKLNKKIYSDVNVVTIDSTPPEIPVINSEPPYSFSNENTITWDFDVNKEPAGFEFLVEKTEMGDLEIIEQVSTNDRGHRFAGLNESKYCFRVKVKDSIGNFSDWSEQTCTVQDFTSPVVESLRLTNEYISPSNSSGILDTTELSFYIDESNIKTWKLFVENSQRQLIYSKDGVSNTHDISLPNENIQLPEGVYFIYLIVQDNVNQIGLSNVIRLVVDNTSPQAPELQTPTKNLKTNNSNIVLTSYSAMNTSTQVLLNKKEFAKVSDTKLVKTLPVEYMIEGENILRLISTDLAGNFIESQQSFVLDRIAPSVPQVFITTDEANESIIFNFDSADFVRAEIYSRAGLVKEVYSSSSLIVEKWTGDSDYYYAVILVDEVGNRSAMSDFASFHTPKKEVLGIGSTSDSVMTYPKVDKNSECYFKYNKTYDVFIKEKCDLYGPNLSKVSNFTSDKKIYTLQAISGYSNKILINIKNVYCKEKSILDPRTWFGCFEQSNSGEFKTVLSNGDIWINVENQSVRHFNRSTSNDEGIVSKHLFSTDVSGKEASILAEVNFSIKGPGFHWIDVFDKTLNSNNIKVDSINYNPFLDGRGKYFRFPFNRIMGVTQWHGYTAFDSPHTGIDFGSYLEPVYAMADGYIAAVGWDNYYGECFSGGNYMKITYDNGMTSFFAHLDNYRKTNGSNWGYGERVSKGELIGLSGNTGSYNCYPLGFHLHMELRKDLWQSSHVNPVPYIDADWMQVETLGEEYYPGRLSGDNPHPEF